MPDVYDLKSVKLPRFSGGVLKAFTALLESPATRWILISNLLQQGGILALRELQIDDPPTFMPPVPQSTHPPAQGQNLEVLTDLAE